MLRRFILPVWPGAFMPQICSRPSSTAPGPIRHGAGLVDHVVSAESVFMVT